MTDTSTSPEVAPPRDYGNGATWADDGQWAVPPDLRPYYATAEPHPQDLRAYVANGVSISEPREVEQVRVVSPGTLTTEPVTTTEKRTITQARDLHGAADYQLWLHMARLQVAAHAKKRAEFQAVLESRYRTCQVCGIRSGGVSKVPVMRSHGQGTGVAVTGCAKCRPALEEAARRAVAARDADRTLPDGRRVGDVAELVVRDLCRTDGAR